MEMTEKDKKGAAPAQAPAKKAEDVEIIANPRLNRGCQGQVILKLDGRTYKVHSKTPLTVTRELYEQMREIEVRGVQAVVLA